MWTPELSGILYEYRTDLQKPMVWATLSLLCVLLNATLDPILLFYLDKPTQRNVLNALTWNKRDKPKKIRTDVATIPAAKNVVLLGSGPDDKTIQVKK